MSSVVYYKFKSQKEPYRLAFDGTGISVFDLKREIIVQNGLSTNADQFYLAIWNPDTNEEYQDDTEVIPRSMSVIAGRLHVARINAAKYVTNAMPSAGRKGYRQDLRRPDAPAEGQPRPEGSGNGAEGDIIANLLQAQGDQWKHTQEHMAGATPIYYSANSKGAYNAPSVPPPPGYVCNRCGQKGHWIQNCPTNNDPNWDGKRVVRTTGIPRSFLQTVEKPTEDSAGSYMMNEDGQYVVAVADNASWQSFQNKTRALKERSDKPTDSELEDPITHGLFVKPVKTPCCSTTYSEESIQQALIDSDFVCPNCGTKDIFLDQLIPDKEMEVRIEKYKKDRGKDKDDNSQSESEINADGSEPSGDSPAEELSKRKRGDGAEELGSEGDEASSKKVKENENGSQNIENEPAENPENLLANMPPLPGLPPMIPGMPPMIPGMPPMMMPGMPGMPPMPMMMPPFMSATDAFPVGQPNANVISNGNNNSAYQRGSQQRGRKLNKSKSPDFKVL